VELPETIGLRMLRRELSPFEAVRFLSCSHDDWQVPEGVSRC